MEVREVQLEAVSEEGNWCRQMEAQSSQVQLSQVKWIPSAISAHYLPPQLASGEHIQKAFVWLSRFVYIGLTYSFLCAHWRTLRQSQTKKAAAAAAAAAV